MTAAKKAELRQAATAREIKRELRRLEPLDMIDAARKFLQKVPPKYRREMLKFSVAELAQKHLVQVRRYGY